MDGRTAQRTIIVQLADTRWTTAAVEAACQIARDSKATLALVLLLSRETLNWKGIDANEYEFTDSEQDDLNTYQRIAATYGVPTNVHSFAYTDLAQTLATVADLLHADNVIAPVAEGTIPFVGGRAVRHLSHVLESHHHHLLTVNQPAVNNGQQSILTAITE